MTRRIKKYNPKYFPFSPGIPWNTVSGKYIIPQVDYYIWHQVLENRDIVVAAYGGPLESFFSLSFNEALVSIEPRRRISWLGNKDYRPFVRAQGLSTVCSVDLTPEKLAKYPVPLFLDAEGRAYLNCLNNYVISRSYWGKYPKTNTDPVLKQIYDNALIPWRDYKPKLRRLERQSKNFERWARLEHIHSAKRLILIFPERWHSLHDVDCLGWTAKNVREFTAMASSFGLPVVVCTRRPGLYHGSRLHIAPNNMNAILNLLTRAWAVLSSEIDWLLMTMMISKANIIARPTEQHLDLYANADFLEAPNVISTDNRALAPIDVHRICEGLT
jgi:hypothetical protein